MRILWLVLALGACSQAPVCGTDITLPASYVGSIDCGDWERGENAYFYERPVLVRTE